MISFIRKQNIINNSSQNRILIFYINLKFKLDYHCKIQNLLIPKNPHACYSTFYFNLNQFAKTLLQ